MGSSTVPNIWDLTSPTCTRYNSQMDDLVFNFYLYFQFDVVTVSPLHTFKCLRSVGTFPASFESPGLLRGTIEGVKKVKRTLETEDEAGAESRGENGRRIKKQLCRKRETQKHTGGESERRNMKRR